MTTTIESSKGSRELRFLQTHSRNFTRDAHYISSRGLYRFDIHFYPKDLDQQTTLNDMGGRTFPDLHVPRLSPAPYATLCAKYLNLLSTYYTRVLIPPPAPGKTSHGDVDFLVFGPLGVPSWSKQEIASALGATRTAKGGPDEWNFAVPIPDDLAEEEEAYVQLDVEQVESVERLKWMTFKKSYGDLWQILGVLLRPMGLVGGDEGLSLSVREIEEGLGPRSMRRILLSRSVEEVLGFLGLDRVKFAEGFGSETERKPLSPCWILPILTDKRQCLNGSFRLRCFTNQHSQKMQR